MLNNQEPDKKTEETILRRNNEIKEVELKYIPALSIVDDKGRFPLKIAYPGLVTGTGLVHDSKKLDGAYNLGMHFDYTWGMPVVYGSSVKGVLRQYFKEFYDGELDKDELFEDIFNGEDILKGSKKSIYHRDIFFDAVIKRTYNGRLLEDDSITPHKNNPLKNPIPITMLKIAPGCTIEFRFHLEDSHVHGGTFKKDKKLELFKKILLAVGVGAKTNVGYGQLELL